MIDVVITTRKRVKELRATVDSFLSSAVRSDTGVVVSCDCDDFGTHLAVQEMKAKYGERFRFVVCPFSGSVVRASNRASASSEKKFVGVFPDDGRMFVRGWDDHVVDLFDRYPAYDCLRIRTHNAGGRDNFAGIPYPFAFFIKSETYRRLGYLDERYGHFGPDTHLGMQMLLDGVLMMTSDRLVFQHSERFDETAKAKDDDGSLARDNGLFLSLWDDRVLELRERHESIRHLWDIRVK